MVEMFVVEGLDGNSPRLAIAPYCEDIKCGDLVVMVGEGQKFRHALTDSITVPQESAFIDMIEKLTGRDVMRAYGKYRFKEYEWEVEENE